MITPLLALCACASDSASRAEVAGLRAEVRALRETNGRLEQRLDRLEAHAAVFSARGTTASKGEATAEVPELTVVKLKPRAEPAPAIDTSTPVVEPSPELLEALAQARSSDGPAHEREEGSAGAGDPTLVEAQYEVGVEALRIGNVAGGVTKLQRFAQENPRHAKADNALYFSGVGQMGLGEYTQAAYTFGQLISSYPAGDAVVDATLKLAECRVRLNQLKDARALYSQIITHYPGTAAATQAEARLSAITP